MDYRRGWPAASTGTWPTFAAHMREGLLAASTAVGLEVMAELMDAEVTALAGPGASTTPTVRRRGTAPRPGA